MNVFFMKTELTGYPLSDNWPDIRSIQYPIGRIAGQLAGYPVNSISNWPDIRSIQFPISRISGQFNIQLAGYPVIQYPVQS